MKRVVPLILLLLLFACSKISESDIQGSWHVEAIQVQIITSNTDSGWQQQAGFCSIFIVNEALSMNKGRITPCPGADAILKAYDNYPGYVNYAFKGNKLNIPDQHYSFFRQGTDQNGFTTESGEVNIQGITFDVVLNDGEMSLSGKQEGTDNLGNVKKRTNVKIDLSRQ